MLILGEDKVSCPHLFSLIVFSIYSRLLPCFCCAAPLIISGPATRAVVAFSSPAASGQMFSSQFQESFCVGFCPSCACGASDPSMIRECCLGRSPHILGFLHFQQLIFEKDLGIILLLCFQNKGITCWTLLLTWVCSKSRQYTDNGRLNSLLFLVAISS